MRFGLINRWIVFIGVLLLAASVGSAANVVAPKFSVYLA